MATSPGPHKSLIQKAFRGGGWGFGPKVYPNFGTPVNPCARSINRFKP